MERHKLVESFNCAIEGIIYVLRTQRNMRIHFAAGAAVIVAALVFSIPRVDFLLICVAIFFVLFAEMVNTAAELTIDLISETYHPLARLVKDIGAGAVMLSSINSIVIGYLVFMRQLERRAVIGTDFIKSLPASVSFLALLVVIVMTVILKIVVRRGTPMMGGMPSVHSAVAFSAATIVSLLVPASFPVILLSYFLALMVVQGRIVAGIHTFSEVVTGALLGVVITLVLYQLYRYATTGC
jgi:diacylglycerol kinase (ATP)